LNNTNDFIKIRFKNKIDNKEVEKLNPQAIEQDKECYKKLFQKLK